MSSVRLMENKETVWRFWQELNESDPERAGEVVRRNVHPEIRWHGPHPIQQLDGVEALVAGFWRPLLHAFPDLQRSVEIFIGGHEHWVASIGQFEGTFVQNWLGIPATGEKAQIRYGEFSAVYEGQVILTYIIPDLLDLIRQAGFQLLPPSLGEEGRVGAPLTGDGVLLTLHDDAEGAKTMAMAKTMCAELNTPQCELCWDTETMRWYGPSGIGTTYGYKGFDELHQQPFYHAFPQYACEFAGLHVAEVGDGSYAGWVGWPSIRAYHTGEYLGCPPTGNKIEWRLMDFYRREGDKIIENWVPVDMIYLFLTMGVDLFAELEKQRYP